ncbi:unnamed protein product [Urochloa humidicola]
MALTVFETSEQQQQHLPCQQAVEQGADGGKAEAGGGDAEKAAATLKETDHGGDGGRPERADIWNMIQAQKPPAPKQAQAPYVHPLVRRSSSLLTQKSLEICTESLGSETGSDGFSDADGSGTDRSDDDEAAPVAMAPRAPAPAPPSRAFPPPLPSLARRKVESTMEMRQERQDGRLLVRVVPVPSSTLFRAQRRGGRLLLSFADTAAPAADDETRGQVEMEPDEHQADDHEEEVKEDEEEEVEVVDRGTVVEFKVSTQPQAGSGSGPRVRRSSLVINKFVGAEPAATCGEIDGGSTTTAVAALAAASVLSATAPPAGNGEDAVPGATCGENKLLMTAKRRSSKEELLNHMRRCNQLRGQLFVWEPRIATSS